MKIIKQQMFDDLNWNDFFLTTYTLISTMSERFLTDFEHILLNNPASWVPQKIFETVPESNLDKLHSQESDLSNRLIGLEKQFFQFPQKL